VGLVVPRGALRVEGQVGLDAITILLADQRRDGGDQGPQLGRGGILTGGGFPQGMRGRAPEPCGPRLGPADVEFSRIGVVRQQPMEGRGTPAPIPTRRPDAKPEEGLGQTEQGPVRVQIAGKDLLDHGAFGRLDLHPSRITRPVWMPAITVGRNGPGQEHAGLQFPLAPTAQAFGKQGAFIFGHGSPDLSEQMGLRVLAPRLIEELDAAPCLREFF
jgi:hypothetical protein